MGKRQSGKRRGKRGKGMAMGIAAAFLVVLASTYALYTRAFFAKWCLDRMLGNLSAGNISRAERYIADGALQLEAGNSNARAFYRSFFSSMHYNISKVERTGGYATATVTITSIDMNSLITEVTVETLEDTFGRTFTVNKSFYQTLSTRIAKGEVDFMTKTVPVYLEKTHGRWKVDLEKSDAFVYAITGGVEELIGY